MCRLAEGNSQAIVPGRMLLHDPISSISEIQRAPKRDGAFLSLLRGPVVDKFFLAGALSAFVGGAYFGVHLWLMRNGEMAVPASFAELRRIHIHLQFFGFFGLFILGFLMQAGPKFLQVPARPGARALWLIPLVILGAILSARSPAETSYRLLLALPMLVAFASMFQIIRLAPEVLRRQFGIWILLSLLGFIFSAFLPGEGADRWLLAHWLAIVPITIGVGQQFVRVFVTGAPLADSRPLVVFTVCLFTGIIILSAYFSGMNELWRAAGIFSLLTLGIYTGNLGLWRRENWKSTGPLPFAFGASYLWAALGALLLSLTGSRNLDFVVHIWALGWITPLILAISAQILENIAGGFLLSRRAVLALLVLWQLVPIGRAGLAVYPLPGGFSIIVASAVTVVFAVWAVSVCWASIQISRRQTVSAAILKS